MQETQETWIRSLGWEDPLEEEMAIHSQCSCLGNSMEEEPGRLQSIGSQRVRHDLVTKLPPLQGESYCAISLMISIKLYIKKQKRVFSLA